MQWLYLQQVRLSFSPLTGLRMASAEFGDSVKLCRWCKMSRHCRKKKSIHWTTNSTRASCYFTATQKDQTHKYCLFGDRWKTNSQLNSSLPLLVFLFLHPHFSPLLGLSVILCKVQPSLQNQVSKSTYCIFLMMRIQAAMSAKTFPLCIPTHVIPQHLFLLSEVYLNTHWADMLSFSCFSSYHFDF